MPPSTHGTQLPAALHTESGSSLAATGGDITTAQLIDGYSKGLSIARLAHLHRLTVPTVIRKLRRFLRVIGNPEEITGYRFHESDVLDAVRWRIVQLLSEPSRLANASVRDLAIVFGILFDKARLLRGQSTQNISIRTDAILLAHRGREREEASPEHTPDLVLPPSKVR